MYADLHMHSTCSDGTDTPDELMEMSRMHGLSVISITDHDSLKAYEAIDTADRVKLIPGVELSTVLGHSYLHILGYYIDISSEALKGYIERTSSEKTENTLENFQNAVRVGSIRYEWERVLFHNQDQPRLSGVHVVKAMREDGLQANGMGLWEMFRKHFRAESPEFIPTETATAYDAVDIIKDAGGIPVIAHPKNIGNDDIVMDLIRYGVQGLEVFHPIHGVEDRAKYARLAADNGLYITGGTDWHGSNSGEDIQSFGMCGLDTSDYAILNLFAK